MNQRRIFDIVLLLIVVGIAGGVYYRYPRIIRTEAVQLYSRVAPCNQPITYRIGTVDPLFVLSQDKLAEAVSAAVGVWNIEGGKKLFQLDQENGTVTISLVYDDRQKTTQTLGTMAQDVAADRSSFEPLQLQYDALHANYAVKKSDFDRASAAYRDAEKAFNVQAELQKVRGAGRDSAALELEAERTQLNYDMASIQDQQAALNKDAEKLNTIAKELNRLIAAYNIHVGQYNVIGSTLSGEFEEGVYLSKPGSEEVLIYQYEDMPHLKRVLAHELGHALGLDHVNDQDAIMYKVNQGPDLHLTVADYDELTKACTGPLGNKGI